MIKNFKDGFVFWFYCIWVLAFASPFLFLRIYSNKYLIGDGSEFISVIFFPVFLYIYTILLEGYKILIWKMHSPLISNWYIFLGIVPLYVFSSFHDFNLFKLISFLLLPTLFLFYARYRSNRNFTVGKINQVFVSFFMIIPFVVYFICAVYVLFFEKYYQSRLRGRHKQLSFLYDYFGCFFDLNRNPTHTFYSCRRDGTPTLPCPNSLALLDFAGMHKLLLILNDPMH